MKRYNFAACCTILFCAVALCGCLNGSDPFPSTTTPPTSPGTTSVPTMTYTEPQPQFSYTVLYEEMRFRPDGSSYYEVQIEARSTGVVDAINVIFQVTLTDVTSGERVTKNEVFERFNSGETKIFIRRFEVNPNHDYQIAIKVDYERT